MRIKGDARQEYQLQGLLPAKQSSTTNFSNDRLFFQNIVGFDYEGNNGVSFGAQYCFFRTPKDDMRNNNELAISYGEDSTRIISSQGNTERQHFQHQVDAYLNVGLCESSQLGIDASYDLGYDVTSQSVTEVYDDAESRTIKMNSDYGYSFFAAKAKMEHELSHFKLFYGAEFSSTSYSTHSTEMEQSASENAIERDEKILSGFCGGDFNFKKFNLALGLRYEHSTINYCLKDAAKDIVSFSDNHLFPDISFSTKFDSVHWGLSYTSKISRPRYYDLRNSVTYSTPLVCVGGNPELVSSIIHSISTDVSYKGFQILLEYEYQANPIVSMASRCEDRQMIIMSRRNLDKAQYLSANLYWSRTINVWTPVASVYLCKPFLDYEGVTYNKLSTSISLHNIVEIAKGWQFYIDGDLNLGGHEDLRLYKTYGQVTAGISKYFLNEKLQVSLYYMDIFKTYRDTYTMATNEVSIYNDSFSGMSSAITLGMTYRFKPTQKRYQGSSAGSDEKGRL